MTATLVSATTEMCNRISRHAYSEDILATAAALIIEFDEFPVDADDIHDADWYITHWTLLDLYEDGTLTKSDYERYEREVDEAVFADFLRCMNGFECECD